MEVKHFPQTYLLCDDFAKNIFNNIPMKQRIWYQFTLIKDFNMNKLEECVKNQFLKSFNEYSPEDFLKIVQKVYQDIKSISYNIAFVIKNLFVLNCIDNSKYTMYILNNEEPFIFNDNKTLTNMLTSLQYMDFTEYRNKDIIKIEKRMNDIFPNNIKLITPIFDEIVSKAIIPHIKSITYSDNHNIITRASTVEAKEIIKNGWISFFKDKDSVTTINDTINILQEISKIEKTYPFVNMDDAKRNIWANDKIGSKRWNKWLNKEILAIYIDKTLETTHLITILSSIDLSQDFTTFIIDYSYSVKSRLITMLLQTQDKFARLYNLERTLLDAISTLYLSNIWTKIKTSFHNALISHHINISKLLVSDTSLLLDSKAVTDDDIFNVPDIFQERCKLVTDTYKDIYHQRNLLVSYKQSIVCLKDGQNIISGTMYPMSVLYFIGVNNGVYDIDILKEKILPKEPKDYEKSLSTLITCIDILKMNKLLINNIYVSPSHNVILREKILSGKQEVKQKEVEVKMNLETVLMCYVVKCTKKLTIEHPVSFDDLYKEILKMLTLYTPTEEDVNKCLQKCIDRETLFMKEIDTQILYSFNE